MSKSSIASNGFLSSITSLFNGTSSDSRSSSLSNTGYLERKRSAFGSGLPSSMRRGPPVSLNEGGGAWDLPYSQYNRKQPDSAAASDGQYPPLPSRPPHLRFQATNRQPLFTLEAMEPINHRLRLCQRKDDHL